MNKKTTQKIKKLNEKIKKLNEKIEQCEIFLNKQVEINQFVDESINCIFEESNNQNPSIIMGNENVPFIYYGVKAES